MRDTTIRIEPFFIDGRHGRLFCMFLMPADKRVTKGLIYLHPFAEEMHKSRRMAALQARALAARGHAVLQVDLTGCGDSAGDFGEATWPRWQDDVLAAHAWLGQHITAPIGLWGLRVGATLATRVAREISDIDQLLLWQPVTSGQVFINQFLRIKLVGELLGASQDRSGLAQLRARLAAGEDVEVGGYRLCPELAMELSDVDLAAMPPPCPTLWLELTSEPDGPLSPVAQQVADAWRAAGVNLKTTCVPCEPFWITQEITECPALISATLGGLGIA